MTTLIDACCLSAGSRWLHVADYAKTHRFWAGRRLSNDYRKASGYTIRKQPDGSFSLNRRKSGFTAWIHPDNTVTFTSTSCQGDRMAAEHLIGLPVYNRFRKNIQQSVRFRNMIDNKSYPMVAGLVFKNQECLNIELAKDVLRKVKPEVRREWTKLFSPWATLMKAVARLTDGEVEEGSWRIPDLAILEGEPNAEDAMHLIEYGIRHGQPEWKRKNDWDYRKRCAIALVQNHLREAYYEEHDGFIWTPEQ